MVPSQGREQLGHGHHGHAYGRVRQAVGKHEARAVEHRATRVDDVGHVSLALRVLRGEERLMQLADDAARVVEVEQERA